MQDQLLFETIIPLLVFLILFGSIAEFVGRSKHIGRWWSFFLLMGIIPGIIALLFSPSAKKEPTKGSPVHLGFAYFFLICSVVSLFSIVKEFNLAFLMSFGGLLSGSLYLFQLSKGNIVNSNPKYYLEEFFSGKTGTSISSKNKNANHLNYYYHIIENDVQSDSLTFDQLRDKKINENTLVWRQGMLEWSEAKNIHEIQGIIYYAPPPIPSFATPPPFKKQ